MQLPSLAFDPSRLAAAATSGATAPGKDRLNHAGVEFESVLLGQWLESAEKSFGNVPGGGGDETDSAGDQMLGFAMQQLAGSIARSGGLGIARLVERSLAAEDVAASGKSSSASLVNQSESVAKPPQPTLPQKRNGVASTPSL